MRALRVLGNRWVLGAVALLLGSHLMALSLDTEPVVLRQPGEQDYEQLAEKILTEFERFVETLQCPITGRHGGGRRSGEGCWQYSPRICGGGQGWIAVALRLELPPPIGGRACGRDYARPGLFQIGPLHVYYHADNLAYWSYGTQVPTPAQLQSAEVVACDACLAEFGDSARRALAHQRLRFAATWDIAVPAPATDRPQPPTTP